jgi:cytochrome b involved in lipid metabolism
MALTPPPQWVVVDAKVYDLTKSKALHPGGTGVLA